MSRILNKVGSAYIGERAYRQHSHTMDSG